LSGYIFSTKARIDNPKKLVRQQYLPHMAHNMVNFGPLAAEIGLVVWGTQANFNEELNKLLMKVSDRDRNVKVEMLVVLK